MSLHDDLVTMDDRLLDLALTTRLMRDRAKQLESERDTLKNENRAYESSYRLVEASNEEWKRALYLLRQVDEMHGEGRRMSGWLVACLMKDIHEFVREKP